MSEPLAPFVVGVDRPSSGAGVAYAATEALRTGRPLELVHVAPELNGWLTIVGRDVLRLAVMRADADVGGQVSVIGTLRRGDPVDELAEAARNATELVLEQVPPRLQRRRGRPVTVPLAALVDVPLVVVPAGSSSAVLRAIWRPGWPRPALTRATWQSKRAPPTR
jgi:hypothetical protein